MAPDINKAKDSSASIFEILDSKPRIDSSSDKGTTLDTVKGDIEFQHVSFKYPTRPDIQIFKDLSLTMPSGKVLLFSIPPSFFDVITKQNRYICFVHVW